MKVFFNALLFLVLLSPLSSAAPTNYLQSLTELSWHHRLILLNGDVLPMHSLSQLNDQQKAINERHILWFWRQDNRLKSNFSLTLSELSQTQITDLLSSHNVVLIGKDGGIKLQTEDFKLDAILALIDGMPMRREEMQRQN